MSHSQKKSAAVFCKDCGWTGFRHHLKPLVDKRGDVRRLYTCPRCGCIIKK